ncbi:MAG TPA: Ger(x)C family spore germination C-terminal domain-containing protein, partial [Symbiobacteriaceae bacterium]|nr:Ger(x)C family spore germination C-terminal domain-containing protein [Symbiobacteriaceae bacterium]
DVNDITCEDRLLSDGDVSRLNKALEARVRESISHALGVARATGSDFFGFGQNLFRHNPGAFLTREKKWDDVLKEMPVTVEVEGKVIRLGQLNKKYRWREVQ